MSKRVFFENFLVTFAIPEKGFTEVYWAAPEEHALPDEGVKERGDTAIEENGVKRIRGSFTDVRIISHQDFVTKQEVSILEIETDYAVYAMRYIPGSPKVMDFKIKNAVLDNDITF